jgi:addiction module RelE/StbE family toxin
VRVVWSARALHDVEEIYRFVSIDKPEAARRLAERLLWAGDELSQHPHLGRQTRAGDLRELIVGNYLLIYRITDVIGIVTVVHGARKKRR